jgi:D-alanyl-D-alanine carboxypeptidase
MRELIATHIKEASLRRTAPVLAERAEPRNEPQPTVWATRAALSSRPDPAPMANATTRAAAASDPIQPVLVKTITYRTAPVQTTMLAPLPTLVPVPGAVPQHAAAPVAATPAPTQSAAAPSTIVVASTEPAAIAIYNPGRPEVSRADRAKAAFAKADLPSADHSTTESAPPPHVHGGWLIQIGAFEGEDEARQHLSAAQLKAPATLAAAGAFTERVQKGDKALYRARFAGFDKATAEAACRQLKRSDIDCMAVRN